MNQSLGNGFIVLFTLVQVEEMQTSFQLISLEAVSQFRWLGGQAISSLKLDGLQWDNYKFSSDLIAHLGEGHFLSSLLADFLPVVLESLVQRSQRLPASLS